MNRRGNTLIAIILVSVITGFVLFRWAIAGSLDPLAGPSDPASAMYTLTDIYNRLIDNTAATRRAGGFVEPAEAPGATGYTLDEIYNIAIPTQVPKTGQTASTGAGDDGDLQAGVAHPAVRFVNNGDGTVTDNLTGLIWLQNADCGGLRSWTNMLAYANALSAGDCNLSDGSLAGDWRLPNIRELQSLIDYGRANPALPNGHPFTNVRSPLWSVTTSLTDNGKGYWTSTSQSGAPSYKWSVNMFYGQPVLTADFDSNYAWPVRDRR